jgi:putative phage-type endonuclease
MALTKEQLANRLIGGSDVATILGLNPYQTPEDLRLQILGRLPAKEETDAMAAGNLFEQGIRDFYAHKTGRSVRRSHQTLVNEKYPWLTVHIDGKIEGEKRGLECKNVHWRLASRWGNEGTDEIAEYYLPQPHTYMLVTGYPVWDVAAYFGGSDLRIYTVEPDPEFSEIILESTHEFWFRNVLEDIECEIDYEHPAVEGLIKKLYPGTNGETVYLGPEIEHWHHVRQEAKQLSDKYAQAADIATFHIQQAMGEAALGVLLSGDSYTRKVVNRKGFEVAATSYVDFRFKKAKE